MLVSVLARDGVGRGGACVGRDGDTFGRGGACLGRDGDSALLVPFACALGEAGLRVTERRAATAADIADLGSSWAARLGIPGRRPAWLLTAKRSAARRGC